MNLSNIKTGGYHDFFNAGDLSIGQWAARLTEREVPEYFNGLNQKVTWQLEQNDSKQRKIVQ